VIRIDFGDFPIMALAVFGDRSLPELEEAVESTVVPALMRIDGVFTVSVTGAEENILVISLNPERMSELGVTVADVALTLSGTGISAPSGFVMEGGLTVPVRTVQPLDSLEDLTELPLVMALPGSAPSNNVKLGDVAQVAEVPSPIATISRTNGQPSLSLGVFKASDANTVEVANEVERTLRRLNGSLAGDVEVAVLFDQSTLIEESIDSLVREGLLGAAFAVLVILVFLVSVRATVVTAVSIPLSMLAAIALLNWQGISLNLMTMGGLTIAVGRVVDDSIVVLENIYVHARRGAPLPQAALHGTREVSTAILSSTLAAVAVFLPLVFIGGIVQEIFLPLALAVTFALLASFVVAITVVPALSMIIIPVMRHQDGDSWLQRIYTPALRWSLRHRFLTLAGAGAIFVGSFALLPLINSGFLSSSDFGAVAGRIELPSGTPLAVTDARARELEATLAEIEAIEKYQVVIGLTDPNTPGAFRGGIPGTNTIDVVLTYSDGVDLDEEALRVRELALAQEGTSANIRVVRPSLQSDSVEIVVSGDRPEDVSAAAFDIAAAIQDIPELENIDNDVTESAPELLVKVDPQQAAEYGVTSDQLALEIRRLLVGVPLGTLPIGGEPMAAVLRAGDGLGVRAESVGDLVLALPGSPQLSDLAELETARGPAAVTRVDQRQAATISASILGTDLAGVSDKVDPAVAAVETPPGVEVRIGGVFAEQREAFSNLYLAMAIGVLVVYLVMVASLGSLTNPFIILFSLPFVTIGSFMALLITGRDLGLPALMGILMLIGIVVTNAIVLLTFVEMLKRRGMGTTEALNGRDRRTVHCDAADAGGHSGDLQPLGRRLAVARPPARGAAVIRG
jgi:HAE1 family hydrophobic/amphiphilic exporter-1